MMGGRNKLSPHRTVTVDGDHVRLREATCVPAPAHLPRVVIGVGRSKDTLQQAATYADELNVRLARAHRGGIRAGARLAPSDERLGLRGLVLG